MGKEGKGKVIGLFLYAILIVIMVSFVVSAQQSSSGNPLEDLNEGIRNFFTDWSQGENINLENSTFVKWLFAFLIILLVYLILDMTGLFRTNKGILFVVSILVGLLSTYFMNQADLLNLLNIYDALGGTLIILIPFLILSAFTFKAIEDGNVQLMVLQHIAWGLFFVFELVNFIRISFPLDTVVWASTNYFHLLILVILIFLTFGNSWVLGFVGKSLIKARVVKKAQTISELQQGMAILEGVARRNR